MSPQEAMQRMQMIAPVAEAVVNDLKLTGFQHSCIYAGSVLTKVLHRLGMTEAYPLTIRAFILNPILTEWVKEHGFDWDAKAEAAWSAIGGRGVGLGEGRPELETDGKWLGHLGVVAPSHFGDRHLLMDLTATQASVPEWQIEMVPMLVRVPDSFVAGETEYKAPAPRGAVAIYKAFPTDREFEGSPIWRDRDQHDLVADRIVGRLKSGRIA